MFARTNSTGFRLALAAATAVTAVTAVTATLLIAGCDNSPEAQAKREARAAFEICMKDLNDPLMDPGAKATIIRPVCKRMRDDFRKKYGVDP